MEGEKVDYFLGLPPDKQVKYLFFIAISVLASVIAYFYTDISSLQEKNVEQQVQCQAKLEEKNKEYNDFLIGMLKKQRESERADAELDMQAEQQRKQLLETKNVLNQIENEVSN